MGLDFLPQLSQCCYCIPLQAGSILICLFTLLFSAFDVSQNFLKEHVCKYLVTNSTYNDIIDYLNWARTGLGMAMIITALIFLIGIFVNWAFTALLFVIVCIVLALVKICIAIMSLVGMFFLTSVSDCSKMQAGSIEGGNLFQAFLLIYFALVANSYSNEMD